MKSAYRIEFTKGKELIVAETLDGEGIDIFVRVNGREIMKIFGTKAQHTELVSALHTLLKDETCAVWVKGTISTVSDGEASAT